MSSFHRIDFLLSRFRGIASILSFAVSFLFDILGPPPLLLFWLSKEIILEIFVDILSKGMIF